MNISDKKVVDKLLSQWFEAAKVGDVETLSELLIKTKDTGLDLPNQKEPRSQQNAFMVALSFANREYHYHAATALMQLTDPLSVDISGWSPLVFAIRTRHEEAIDYLLPRSDLLMSCQSWSPLMHAAHFGQIEAVKGLLGQSDVLKVDEQGENALMLAAETGHLDCVKELASKMSDFDQKNKHGRTALDLANDYHHYEVQGFLREIVRVREEEQILTGVLKRDDVMPLIALRAGPKNTL